MTRYNDDLQPKPLTGHGDYGERCHNVKTLTGNYSPGKPPVTGEWLQFAATREGLISSGSWSLDIFERKILAFRSRKQFRAETRDGPEHKPFLRKGNPFNRFLYQVLKQSWLSSRYGMDAIKGWLFCLVSHPHRAEMARLFNGNARILHDRVVSKTDKVTARMPHSEPANKFGDNPGMELQGRDGTLFRYLPGKLPGDRAEIMNTSYTRITWLDVAGSLARDGTREIPDGEVRLIRPWCNTTMARDGTARIFFNSGVKMPGYGTDMPEPHSVVKFLRDIAIGIPFDEIGMLTPILSGSMHDDETKRTFRFADKTMFKTDCKLLYAGFYGMIVPVNAAMMKQDGTNFAFKGRSKRILRIGILKLAACLGGNQLCTVERRRSYRLQVLREMYFRWRKSFHENGLFLLLKGELCPGGKSTTTIRNSIIQLFVRLETDRPRLMHLYNSRV